MATVADVISGVKWQVDKQLGNRLLSADLIPEVDAFYKEAWGAIVAQYDDYLVKKLGTDITITGGAGLNSYQIVATDFWKVKAVQKLNGSVYDPPLPRHELNEVGRVDELSYRLVDDTLYFEPELSCGGTYRLWYVYTPAALTATGDVLKDVNDCVKRFCVDAVAARALQRDEKDPTYLEKLKAEMMNRIARETSHRNAGRGRRIQDTRRESAFRFMTRSGRYVP